MKQTLKFLFFAFMLNGCLYINDRGVDTRLYNECKEYYDAAGMYHKKCDKNLVESRDLNPKRWFE